MDLTLIPEFKLRLWENIMNLNVKDAASCKYDMISLGEIMLRLDPGEGRIKTRVPSEHGRAAANTMSQEDSDVASVCVPRLLRLLPTMRSAGS